MDVIAVAIVEIDLQDAGSGHTACFKGNLVLVQVLEKGFQPVAVWAKCSIFGSRFSGSASIPIKCDGLVELD